MATGNKRVKGRINKRKSKVGKRPERRGGKRSGAGQPRKIVASVRADMRDGLIAEIRARAKKEKKSEHAVWVDILYDKKYRATNAGGKLVAHMFEVIYLGGKPVPGIPGKPLPTGEGDEDDPDLIGPPKLRPMEPDPALKMKVA